MNLFGLKCGNHTNQRFNVSASLLVALALACFGISPMAQAVNPAPDGGYPGGNTAEGQNALFSLTTGGYNTAVGFLSLRSNTTNSFNTAVGAGALFANTADQNTAIGFGALLHNTAGLQNTANGTLALFSNTTGDQNTANGAFALFNNIGIENAANGAFALTNNTTGSGNTTIGFQALSSNTTGNLNTGLGAFAGTSVSTANNVTCVGANVVGANVSNSCYIGNIWNQPVDPATAIIVLADANGKLGTFLSSRRYKHDIKLMDKSSEAILALKPVTFHYKIDAKGTPQYGLIAEEVAKVNPDLVVRDKNGELLTVRYEAVNAMLLNEFLKEHRKVEEQGREMQEQKVIVARQQKQIEALTAGLQKVSAQLELSKSAPQTVLNNQ